MPTLHHFPHPTPVGHKEGTCPMATYLHACGGACRVARAQGRRPLCSKTAVYLHVALTPLPLNTVLGHCDQLTGLECLAMTRAKADSLCLAWWACSTLFRGAAHSAQPLLEQGQSASEFAFCYSVTVVYGKSIPRSAVESKAHHRPCPGPWILSACPAAGAARSPGKSSVSCQRET